MNRGAIQHLHLDGRSFTVTLDNAGDGAGVNVTTAAEPSTRNGGGVKVTHANSGIQRDRWGTSGPENAGSRHTTVE
jgi:hypothetical protein